MSKTQKKLNKALTAVLLELVATGRIEGEIERALSWIMFFAKEQPDMGLAYWVPLLESSEPGRLIVARNPAKRLYAVLKPTPDEYAQRFRALFDPVDDIGRWLTVGVVQWVLEYVLCVHFVEKCARKLIDMGVMSISETDPTAKVIQMTMDHKRAKLKVSGHSGDKKEQYYGC